MKFPGPLLLCLLLALHIPAAIAADWPQWRGPTRDGRVSGVAWPDLLKDRLQRRWRVELGPGYSGPVVAGERVFVTEAKDKRWEIVRCLDRQTGRELWRQQWEGYVSVPFFAKANGDWIRSTPAFADGFLFVGGMRDVLVCLNAATGEVVWRVDFPRDHRTPVPDFGFVSSPLVLGDAVYVQAGAGFARLDKRTGKIAWRALADGGGMWGSAFSSPVLATIDGVDQLVVQSRQKLAGVSALDGGVLWEQPIEAFRGMNILTPVVADGRIFASSYGGKTLALEPRRTGGNWTVAQPWAVKLEGYMSTPVVIDGHVYLHGRNQKFQCVRLADGSVRWTTPEKFGKYWSLVTDGRKILALDQTGKLRLIAAHPERFDLLDTFTVAEKESWAHLAVSGSQLWVRDLGGVTAFEWVPAPRP